MGKFTHRGIAIAAVTMAGALCFSSVASADTVDGEPIDVDGGTVADNPDVDIFRFADEDRIGTAVQAAERTNLPYGGTIIVANSAVFADALAATTFADAIDAPVLLNTPGTEDLNDKVEDYIADRQSGDAPGDPVTEILFLGGTDVFEAELLENVESEDDEYDGVETDRISGVNRYQTAVRLAQATQDEGVGDGEGEGDNGLNIFLASGTDFPDALSAGAAAAAADGVVVLTKGDEGLDTRTFDYVNRQREDAESVVAIGGPAADAAAEGSVDGTVETDQDIVGVNRYETATLTAEEFLTEDDAEAENYVIASGENFPDAVVGGAYAANADGALLLTKQDNLTNVTADFIEDQRLDVENVFVFGGTGSVSRDVSDQIGDLEFQF